MLNPKRNFTNLYFVFQENHATAESTQEEASVVSKVSYKCIIVVDAMI